MAPERKKKISLGETIVPYGRVDKPNELVVDGSTMESMEVEIDQLYFPITETPKMGSWTCFRDRRGRFFKGFMAGVDFSGCYFAYIIQLRALKMKDLRGVFYKINEVISIKVIFGSKWLWLGVVVYALSMILWVYILSRFNVKYAYPISATAIFFASLFQSIIQKTMPSGNYWLGLIVVFVGLVILSSDRGGWIN